MRVSWYADTGIAVFSIWQGGTCTGTFRLPIPELPRMIEALRKGPPGAAGRGSLAAPDLGWRAAEPTRAGLDPGPPTSAIDMAPELAPDARRAGDDYPPGYPSARPEYDRPDPLRDPGYAGHQSPERDAGYHAGPPHGGYENGYEEFPPEPEIPITSGSYRDAPGYRYDTPAEDYEDDGQDGGYHDIPPGGYDRPVAGGSYGDALGYQDAREGFGAAPRGGYGDFAPAADPGPPGGYQDAPRHRQVPRHMGPPSRDEEPAPAGYAAHASAGQEDRRPPTGPLPVGRWQGDQDRQYPVGHDPLRLPADSYGGSQEPGYGGHPEGDYGGSAGPGYGGHPEGDYGGSAGPGYGGHPEGDYGGSPGPDYGSGEPDGSFGFDPLGGDYTGEAEQGYLPGPPTETFRPVPPVSGYTGQASRHGAPGPDDGYEPHQDDVDDAYSLRDRQDRLPSESFAYHPGHTESPDREYRSPRRRS